MDKLKIEGLEAARQEFNKWQGNAVIFVDFEDMTAWCLVFDIPSYHSEKIIKVAAKDNLYGRDTQIGADRLDQIVALMHSKMIVGWPKHEIQEPSYYDTDESFIFI